MAIKKRFAGYPSAVAYENPDGKKAVQHLLWGSFVGLEDERQGSYTVKGVHGEEHSGQYARVRIRGREEPCWIREHEIQAERCLEVIFVDIGQGDGCLLVTPKDKHMVIDAGEGDNMYRFLRWRYGRFQKRFPFEAAIISHPDSDHYKGFNPLFDDEHVFFETIYHNGILERVGKDTLGPKEPASGRGEKFLTELIRSKQQLADFLADTSNWQKTTSSGRISSKQYPKMLKKALDGDKFGEFKMLSIQDGFMPGYGPKKELSIEVLGPVVEPPDADPPRLRWMESKGKTKNGHSVVLRLQYRNVSLMLGGDLNIPSENLLLSHHTGLASPPSNAEDEEALVAAARKVFQVDIAKSCHHGSSDFSPVFLKATHPIATVISSGDEEPHSHPRSDTLGTIGRHSRGSRPLIFSTELARSAPEAIKHPYILRREFEAKVKALSEAPDGTDKEKRAKEKLRKELEEMGDLLNRSVATYGAISVVTDGHKVVIAQKLERPRSSSRKWDIYRLEPEGKGPLRYQSKH